MSQAPEVMQEVHLPVPFCPSAPQPRDDKSSTWRFTSHRINNCHEHTSNVKVLHTPSPHFYAALEHIIEQTRAITILNSSHAMYVVLNKSDPPTAIIRTNSGTGIPQSSLQHSMKENNQEWCMIHGLLFKNADQQSAQSIRITRSGKEWNSNETSRSIVDTITQRAKYLKRLGRR